MNIAYVLPIYWPAVGGCEIHTHELVVNMSEANDVRVITRITSQEEKREAEEKSPFYSYLWFGAMASAPRIGPWSYREGGARVHILKVGWFSRKWLYPLVRYHHRIPELSFNLLKAFFGKKMDRKLKHAEIIHCIHGGVSFLGAAALDCARIKGIPFVYTPVLHLINQQWLDTYKRRRKEGREFDQLPGLELSCRGWHDFFWLRLCKKADALITMTEFEKEFFIREGIPEERIFPIGVGPILASEYDGDSFRIDHNLGSQPVVLFLGRNHLLKGIRELLEAARIVWADYPDVQFVFIGPLEGEAREEFDKRADPRVHVLGEVSHEDKTSALAACDLLCLPSLNESFGGVFLEAWSFGKPVIGGDIPPVRELLQDGKGGFLVMPEPAELADRITRIVTDSDLSTKMGMWGREKVLAEHTWEKITENMEEVYRALLRGDLSVNPLRYEDGGS